MCPPGIYVAPLSPCPWDLEPQNPLLNSIDPASRPYASSKGPSVLIHISLKHTG